MRKIFIAALVSMGLIFSKFAMALSCYYGGVSTNVTDEVTLDSIVYLSGTTDDTIIWKSPSFNRDITCVTAISEDVYVYPFPKRDSETLPVGVKMGLILNGKDLGTFDSTGKPNDDKVDTGWHINNTTATKTFTIQAYMKKDGNIDTKGVSSKISLFQLDGVQGLNPTPNSNYNFFISGWDNIGSVDCTSNLKDESFTLNDISTDKAFSKSASQTVNAPKISVSCTGSSPQVLSALKSISGDLEFTGTEMSSVPGSFKTNKDDLGLNVLYNNSAMSPGKSTDIDVPVSNGVGSIDVPLNIKPVITELELNKPAWLYSEQGSSDIQSSIGFGFTPKLANTQ